MCFLYAELSNFVALGQVLSGELVLSSDKKAGGGGAGGSCSVSNERVVKGPCVLGARHFLAAVERKETCCVKSTCRMARFDVETLIGLADHSPSQVLCVCVCVCVHMSMCAFVHMCLCVYVNVCT